MTKNDKPKITRQRIKKYVETIVEAKFHEITEEMVRIELRKYKRQIDIELNELINRHLKNDLKTGPIKKAFEEYLSKMHRGTYLDELSAIEWALGCIK